LRPGAGQPGPPGSGERPLTALTVNEIRQMHAVFSRPARPARHYWHCHEVAPEWVLWARHVQFCCD